MLDKILRWVSGATEAGVSLIGLAIVLQVVFGGSVPFLGGDVIGTVIGLVGLISAGILYKLFAKD